MADVPQHAFWLPFGVGQRADDHDDSEKITRRMSISPCVEQTVVLRRAAFVLLLVKPTCPSCRPADRHRQTM